MFFQFGSTKSSSNTLPQYAQDLEENIQALYTKLVTNYDNQKTYKAPQWKLTCVSFLTSCSQELNNYKHEMIVLYTQLDNMSNTFNQSKHSHTKWGLILSLFDFLFGISSSTEEINATKNNMEILKGNQDTLSNQIKQTFNSVN